MHFFRTIVATFVLVVGATLFGVSPAFAATRTVCAVGCDFTTIAAAVAAAAPNDTISIGPGTYQEHSILINKPLNIVGAGIDTTVVDGQGLLDYATSGVFTVRVPNVGSGSIGISGLTIVNVGKTLKGTIRPAISMSSPQATTTITSVTFDSIKIVGTGIQDYGIYATGGAVSPLDPTLRQVPTLTVSNSSITGTYYNGIGVDAWNANLLIEGNTLAESTADKSAILIMNEYSVNRMTAANVIRNNTSTGRLLSLRNDVTATPAYGGYDSLTVTGNTISGLAGSDFGISAGTNANNNDASSRIGTVTITGNTITGNGTDLGTSGVLIRGLVENAVVNENNISGVGSGISVTVDKGQSALTVQANRNRLFANNDGVNNSTSATIDANDNWWGCLDGPTSGNGYCATATNTATGTIDTTRWISAVASATSPSITAGASTGIVGQFGALNTGTAIALPSFFTGLSVAFTTDNGTVAPASGVLDGSLAGATTYTAPATVGPDEVRVAIDRADFTGAPAVGPNPHYGSLVVQGQPIPIPITVNAATVAPIITSGTQPRPRAGAPYSFQVTATGYPAPTFAITSGALPPGLTLSTSGLISGTPTGTGSFSFTITASNGTNPSSTTSYTINVARESATNNGLAVTGTSSTMPLALGGIVTVIIGGVFALVARPRRFRTQAA